MYPNTGYDTVIITQYPPTNINLYPDFTHTYNKPGIFEVVLYAESYCGSSYATDSIEILPAPDSVQFVINDDTMCFTCPTNICLGDTVFVTAVVYNSHAETS